MVMKRRILLFCFLVWMFNLSAIRVVYSNSSQGEVFNTKKVGEVDYYNVYELKKLFDVQIEENILENNLSLGHNDRKLVFLISASYVIFDGDIYNFSYPLRVIGGKYYLPVTTLSVILPKFDSQFTYDENRKEITVAARTFQSSKIDLVVIDAGHGGKDPGAVGKRSYEKNLTLNISQKVARALAERGVNVLLTRNTDEFVELRKRAQLANDNKADLFISIHCNASRYSNRRGTEVFILSTSKVTDERVQEAIATENSVVSKYEGASALSHYDGLDFVLKDMTLSEHLLASNDLAHCVQEEMVKETGFNDRGVKQGPFYVLKGAFMPAILIELGFISNATQEKQLNSATYQTKFINAIVNGVIKFKREYEKI